MKKISIIPILLLLPAYIVVAQTKGAMEMKPEMTEIWDPEVPIVKSGKTLSEPPTDAIILFDGSDLSKEWTNSKGEKPTWKVENGCLTVLKGAGDIKTKRVFEDCQLHIEWRSPEKVEGEGEGEGQGRGNSGILLQERYEIQVLDSYNNRTYRNGQAASIYKQYAPLVNVCKAPGEWQTYDIIYTAPRFKDDGTFFTPPMITVIHNGVVVQNHVKLRGPTLYIGIPEYAVKKHGAAALVLQDHGNPVSFRNIWIRKL